MKSLINRTTFGTLSILTALSLGSIGAAEPQGCEEESTPMTTAQADALTQAMAQQQVGTTTTTSAEMPSRNAANGDPGTSSNGGNGANANGTDGTTNQVATNANGANGSNGASSSSNANAPAATDPDPTTSTNAGYGSMQMPNPRTPLTSYSDYDLQDQSGAGGGGYTPASSSYVIPQASYPEPNYSAMNGGPRLPTGVNAANQVITSGSNGTVAPLETNGYGVTPAVSGSGAYGTTASNGQPVSQPASANAASAAGSNSNQSFQQYPNGIRNYSSASTTDGSSVSNASRLPPQSQPFRSQPQPLQAQQQGVTVGGGGRR